MGQRRQSHGLTNMVAFLLLIFSSARLSAAPERIVAIGDVHGSFPQLVGILQQVGLIDANRRWVGGSATLVQTGDVPDRGPRTRDCLDLLMALEQEARRENGTVIPLLGNHEVMVMLGDFRYVSREDYASFADDQSEARRGAAYREYRSYVDASPRRRKDFGPDEAASRQKWMQEHPPGFFELRDAFGPQGFYGRWLRTHDAVVQVDDVIFLHGGLSPKFRFRDFHELNGGARAEIRRFDELWELLAAKKVVWRYMNFREAIAEVHAELKARAESIREAEQAAAAREMREFAGMDDWSIISSDGPLWYRGFAQESEEQLKPFVIKMLGRSRALHVVVGHSIPDYHQVTSRLGRRIVMIDTAMVADGRGGRASALEIRNETFTAHYSGGERHVLWDPASPNAAPAAGPMGSD